MYKYLKYFLIAFLLSILTYFSWALTSCNGIASIIGIDALVKMIFSGHAIICYVIFTALYFIALIGINIATKHDHDNDNNDSNNNI